MPLINTLKEDRKILNKWQYEAFAWQMLSHLLLNLHGSFVFHLNTRFLSHKTNASFSLTDVTNVNRCWGRLGITERDQRTQYTKAKALDISIHYQVDHFVEHSKPALTVANTRVYRAKRYFLRNATFYK